MGQSTQELTSDIEQTRRSLSDDIDELNDKVNPGRVMERRKEAARNRLGSLRDKVMGSAADARQGTATAGESVQDAGRGAMQSIEQRTEGNPLAAGLVAFGAGMLISALVPASDKEQQAAQRVVDTAKEQSRPLMDRARSAGQEMGQHLKESAAGAAEDLKAGAQQSAQHVKEEGRSSAETVKQDAQRQM